MANVLDWINELKSSAHSEGRDGIHISAQLRVDAMQLEGHRIRWAARTMETAANRIDELEQKLLALQPETVPAE